MTMTLLSAPSEGAHTTIALLSRAALQLRFPTRWRIFFRLMRAAHCGRPDVARCMHGGAEKRPWPAVLVSRPAASAMI